MIRIFYPFVLSLGLFFVFGNFQCEKFECDVPYLLRDWKPALLDNSGFEPFVTEGPIPRRAFGFRLTASLSGAASDTLPYYGTEDCFLLALHPIRQIQIFAGEGFDTIPVGEDISKRFRVRFDLNSTLDYLPLDGGYMLNSLSKGLDGTYPINLLMIEPPSQPGAYRFEVKITFDSIGITLNPDTSFILPTVVLQ